MSELVIFAFENEKEAFQMRAALVHLQAEYLIDLEDAVVVTIDSNGRSHLHQLTNAVAEGAMSGAVCGVLISFLFLNPLGLVAGAGVGALAGKLWDTGISDKFMKELAEELTPGRAALFLLVRKSSPDKLLERLSPFAGKGKLLQTSLSCEKDERLRRFIEGPVSPAPAPE